MLSATFYVNAIILCYTKNIYKICNCKLHPESKFPSEYIVPICPLTSSTKPEVHYISQCRHKIDRSTTTGIMHGNLVKFSQIFTHHLSGPDRAASPVCMCVSGCPDTLITFERNDL